LSFLQIPLLGLVGLLVFSTRNEFRIDYSGSFLRGVLLSSRLLLDLSFLRLLKNFATVFLLRPEKTKTAGLFGGGTDTLSRLALRSRSTPRPSTSFWYSVSASVPTDVLAV